MTWLLIGLVFFLGVHSTRIVADEWRAAQIARVGAGVWKIGYSLLSVVGIVLVIYGYGVARQSGIALWAPPMWTRHLASLLMLVSFVLIVAAYVPGTHIKAAVGHPMAAGVKTWALAHLLSNGRLADVILFGAFLLWAVASFVAARRRDRLSGTTYPAVSLGRDAVAVVVGVVAWAGFAMFLHARLIGVAPFG